MIADHFQLREEPFQRAVPEAGLLRPPGFEEGLRRLHYLAKNDGIGLVIGETGAGKTTLLREFARAQDPGRVRVCYASFTSLRSFGFLIHLGSLVGVTVRRFKGEMAKAVLDALVSGGRRTVLIVDEAHQLPDDTLEDLRLLSASHFDSVAGLSLVLAGQPTLKDRLEEPQRQALYQRIALRFALPLLSKKDTADYLELRLRAAGGDGRLFDRDAIDAIFSSSRGVPRLINTIATHSLLAALGRNQRLVTAECVQDALVSIEHF